MFQKILPPPGWNPVAAPGLSSNPYRYLVPLKRALKSRGFNTFWKHRLGSRSKNLNKKSLKWMILNIKKTLFLKEKYFEKLNILAKISQNIVACYFVSKHVEKKSCIQAAEGVDPPPLAGVSPKNASLFFTCSLSLQIQQ